MVKNIGELQTYNPDRQLSEKITLKNIVKHNEAMRLAYTGTPEDTLKKLIMPNDEILFKLTGLKNVISSQQCIISDINAKVELNDRSQWRKNNEAEDGASNDKFYGEDNDYNELVGIFNFLNECANKIRIAKNNNKQEKKFIVEKSNYDGDISLELTNNFFDMLKLLVKSFKSINSIMYIHKIVSSGYTNDEELDDKRREEEAMRRIEES